MRTGLLWLTATLLFSGVSTTAVAADTASGFYQFKDQRIEFNGGAALRWADPDNPGKFLNGVVLTSQTVDLSHAKGAMDPLEAVSNALDWDQGFLRLKLGGSDDALTIDHYFVMPGSFNSSGNAEEKIAIKDGRMKGSWTLPPTEFFGDTYEVQFNFDLAVVEIKEPGTPLAAGGAEPGAAYTAYIAALVKGDADALKNLLSESQNWRFAYPAEGNDRVRALEDEALYKPVKVTVLGGWVDGDRAQLRVEGPGRFGGKFAGRVMMVREGGAWKVEAQELR
jgi:hypothetical protein